MVKHFWIYVNNDHFCLQNHMPISSKNVKENWNIHQQFIWNMPSKSPNHMQKSANQSATQVNWMISVKPNMKNVLSEIYTFTLTGPSCLRYTQKIQPVILSCRLYLVSGWYDIWIKLYVTLV